MTESKRTWCKYGDCSLENLEIEITKLDQLWSKLEKDWNRPEDIEDVYRIYPLLDTTATLARKKLVIYSNKNKNYTVEVVVPTNKKTIDTSKYIYSDEHKFFNGNSKKELLANVVSTFLHGSEYVYMDTRMRSDQKDGYKIYVFVKTDKLCASCAEANLDNPKKDKINYRKTLSFVTFSDCVCGEYIEIRSYIDAIKQLAQSKIDDHAQVTSR